MRNDASNSTRRAVLMAGAAVAAIGGIGLMAKFGRSAAAATIESKPGKVTIEKFSDAGQALGKETVDKVVKAEAEWKAQLSPEAFVVTRQEGTERPFTGPNFDNHAAGLYRCVDCENALFTSDTKFESGTGWPSFWQPIGKENVIEISDTTFGMRRTAVSCALCDAHLGHVFNDGPPPTGLRYCMNGVAMRFIARPTA